MQNSNTATVQSRATETQRQREQISSLSLCVSVACGGKEISGQRSEGRCAIHPNVTNNILFERRILHLQSRPWREYVFDAHFPASVHGGYAHRGARQWRRGANR